MPIDSNMSGFLRKMERAARAMEGAPDEIAQEVAYEIHDEAIKNASGPNYMADFNKEVKADSRRKKKRLKRKYSDLGSKTFALPFFKYQSSGKLHYPVPVITGTFRRAHKVERVGLGVYRVFGDLNVANYFTNVHDGTSKMEGRPTIDDAAKKIIDSGKAINITRAIVKLRLREAGVD
jgi:hypothetical protein